MASFNNSKWEEVALVNNRKERDRDYSLACFASMSESVMIPASCQM